MLFVVDRGAVSFGNLMEYRAQPNARSKEYLIIEHVTRHVWEAPAAIF